MTFSHIGMSSEESTKLVIPKVKYENSEGLSSFHHLPDLLGKYISSVNHTHTLFIFSSFLKCEEHTCAK